MKKQFTQPEKGSKEPARAEMHKINREITGPMRADDFLSADIQTPEEFIEDLLTPGLTMLGSDTKEGKTAFALYMATCLCSGNSLFETHTINKPRRVHYEFISEDTLRFRKRVEDLDAEIDGVNWFYFDLNTKEHYKNALFIKLLKVLIQKRKLDGVFIDTFDDVLDPRARGRRQQQADLLRQLRELANDTQTAIIAIHHSSKSYLESNLFQGKTLEAGADNVLLLSKFSEEATRGIYVLQHYGRLYPKKELYLQRAKDSSVFTQLSELPAQDEVELQEKVKLLVDYGVTQKEISKVLGMTQGYISKVINNMGLQDAEADVTFDDIEEFIEEQAEPASEATPDPEESDEEEEKKEQDDSSAQ